MIEQIHQQTGHGIRPICQVLAVPRSSFYHASNPTPCQAADIESLMGTLKNEMLQGGTFASEADARTEIFDFIESYCNHHRKHSSLSPLLRSKQKPYGVITHIRLSTALGIAGSDDPYRAFRLI